MRMAFKPRPPAGGLRFTQKEGGTQKTCRLEFPIRELRLTLLAPLRVPVGVDGCETGPFVRQIFEREDGRHRTDRNAGTTVDAFRGVNVELCLCGELRFILARMNAVHRADIHAGGVFCADAGLGNHIGHSRSPLSDSAGASANRHDRQKSPYIMRLLAATSCQSQLYAGGKSFSTG